MSRADRDDEFSAYDEARPKQKSKSGCWIWAIVILIIGTVLGGIGCCGGFFYFGLNVFNEEIKAQIKDNAILQEQLGELESMSVNFVKTGEANNDDVIVYDVKGSKASGTLAVEHTSNGAGDILVVSAQLTLSDGQTFELFPAEADENASPDVQALPIEVVPEPGDMPADLAPAVIDPPGKAAAPAAE